MQIRDFLYYFMEVKTPMLALNTVNGYSKNIEHINNFIGDRSIEDIKPFDIQRMYIDMQKILSGTSVVYVHRVLSQAFKFALMQDIVTRNPCDFVIPPKKSKFKPVVLSFENAQKLLSSCVGTDLFIPVALSLLLGLRRGEVLGLMYSDFDRDKMTLSVSRSAIIKGGKRVISDTKTLGSVRTLLLSESLYFDIMSYPTNADGFLCGLTQSALSHKLSIKLNELGLPHMRFHDLRHTCATLMISNNIPAKIVSNRLGHSKVSTTLDIYTHVTVDMQSCAATAFDTLLSSAHRA